MSYNIRFVVDVQNIIQSMPSAMKTFGYGMALVKGTPQSSPIVNGPFTSVKEVADTYGSNSEAVRIAQTYFSGGFYGKPAQFYVCVADTETIASLNTWNTGNQYISGDKVSNNNEGYICIYPHISSGSFSTNLWRVATSEEAAKTATEWESGTTYVTGQYIKITGNEVQYYQCVYEHTSGDEFTLNCWESYVPSGKPIAEIMPDVLQSSANYYIILPSGEFDTQECIDIAVAVESADIKKTVFFNSADLNMTNPTFTSDLASRLKALEYDRSMTIYNPLNSEEVSEYESAAVASGYATVDFTSARPMLVQANKKLSGVTALDTDSLVYNALKAKYANFYTKTTDIDTNMFIDARMASGQFFDTIQCADWLAYNITYELAYLMQNKSSIPFNEDGFKLIKSRLEKVAVKALKANVIGSGYDSDGNYIENGYNIIMPELTEISTADKANRVLRNVRNIFLMAGSVQAIVITNDIQF